VDYLAEFVDSLENAPILRENLDELQQTVNLMQTENPDDFFDIATRNKKFGRVDAMNGPKILEKYDSATIDKFGIANRSTGSRTPFRALPEMIAWLISHLVLA